MFKQRTQCIVVALMVSILRTTAWFPSYSPQYCSHDHSIESRRIPELSASQQANVANIEQVQVMLRHGARTPYTNYSCWLDYDVIWNNCNVTELYLASPSYNSLKRPAEWLFRKLYDGSPNYLGGNCLTGQLLYEGYKMEETNGNILYNAYLNGTYNIFDTDVWEDIDTNYQMYLRSDDEQRTLMSGQIVLHTMFNVSEETIVSWHTGDADLDQIAPNSDVCTALDSLSDYITETPEFLTETNSEPLKQLDIDLNNIWGKGMWSWYNALDCMMTTVCTGNELPDGSADTTLMNEAIFNATIEQVEFNYSYVAKYNNSYWSKLGMGSVIWHMRNNLENIIYGEKSITNSYDPLKFVMFSAHDTSVMPLLAALIGPNWDGKWADYASLVAIELYSASAGSPVGSGGYYFRLVYNGVPQLMPGCPDVLCDATLLLDAMAFASEDMPECNSVFETSATAGPSTPTMFPTKSPPPEDDDEDCWHTRLSTAVWCVLMTIFLFLGGGLGAGAVFLYEKHAGEQDEEELRQQQQQQHGRMTEAGVELGSSPMH